MKNLRKCIMGFMLCATLLLMTSGCNDSLFAKYESRISDYRNLVMRYESERFRLDVVSGWRELDYAADGVSGKDKVEYTVFTLQPKAMEIASESVTLKVNLGGKAYELLMTPHPFKDTYSTELQTVPTGSETGALQAEVNGETVQVENCVPNAISGEYALEIAVERLSENADIGNVGEIYLRLTENTVSEKGGWYWYFAADNGTERLSVLMDAENGEIRAVGE